MSCRPPAEDKKLIAMSSDAKLSQISLKFERNSTTICERIAGESGTLEKDNDQLWFKRVLDW